MRHSLQATGVGEGRGCGFCRLNCNGEVPSGGCLDCRWGGLLRQTTRTGRRYWGFEDGNDGSTDEEEKQGQNRRYCSGKGVNFRRTSWPRRWFEDELN